MQQSVSESRLFVFQQPSCRKQCKYSAMPTVSVDNSRPFDRWKDSPQYRRREKHLTAVRRRRWWKWTAALTSSWSTTSMHTFYRVLVYPQSTFQHRPGHFRASPSNAVCDRRETFPRRNCRQYSRGSVTHLVSCLQLRRDYRRLAPISLHQRMQWSGEDRMLW